MTPLPGGAPDWSAPPQRTRDFERVRSLPRRWATDEHRELMARAMTAKLRRPEGRETLWPTQGYALCEIAHAGGGFLPIKVGGGKTLVSLLAATVMQRRRPLLLVPAKLREKTRRAWREKAEHWQICAHTTIASYETISQVNGMSFLEKGGFDLIVADEAHKLKSSKAGVTKKIKRYLHARPDVGFVSMSGTHMKRSLFDYAHLARWGLRDGAPVPFEWLDLLSWAAVLDDGGEEKDPGVLGPEPREWFRKRLIETVGVVTAEEPDLDVPIVISKAETPEMPRDVAAALADMRNTWCTPDGQPFKDAVEMWRHARELSLGWFSRWDPAAPPAWLEARREWSAFARAALAHSQRYDTELAIVQGVERGELPEGREPLRRWRAIRETFIPNPVPVWLSDYMIDWISVRNDDARSPELIWTMRVPFAERLSAKTGITYYGREGRSRDGRSVIDATGRESVIVSALTVREGFDLQPFSRNLVAEVFTAGDEAEQLIARTHRKGQKADEISVELVIACDEHARAVRNAVSSARATAQNFGGNHKLLIADWTFDP